jgi:endonuclease/exonuclease/phosphatase (EEP) superfamily protein YafD
MGAGWKTGRMPEREPSSGSRLPWILAAVALALLPWAWFLVRDRAPLMDLVAVALPPIGMAAVLLFALIAAVRRSWLGLLVTLSAVAFTVVATVEPRLPQRSAPPTQPLLLVSANVFEGNDRPGDAVASLRAAGGDVLALFEAEPSITEPIDAAYRHNIDEDHISIHSSFPMRELASGASIRRQRVVRARVWGPAGPFILYAVHQMNPLYDAAFAEQTQALDALIARAESERQPVVLAGDFNMSDRSRGYRTLTASFRDAMRAGDLAGSTYDHGLWSLLFLRIDHVFSTPSWCAGSPGTLDVPGSDHEGVRVVLGPCPTSG